MTVTVPAAVVLAAATVLPAVRAPAVARVADELDDALDEARDRLGAAAAATPVGVPAEVLVPVPVLVVVRVPVASCPRVVVVVRHHSSPLTVSR
ncbi:MAG TPA: hypothetical protein VFW79_04645 [Cellulomonas sp.]|uniref:hypothetical protein n=1 Tax=Cellulomonas sp. TaxID=40001 RepID=UPI002E33B2FA|nr:hypothetical protein [Cellulomonas sp.]HEX5331912.1 hypothetical protein [Cellulomonas sp.]